MSLIDLNGHNITGSVFIPMVGLPIIRFSGDQEFDVPDTGNVVHFGKMSIVCSKVRADKWHGSTIGTLIGGAGGWQKVLPSKFYRLPSGIKLSLILQDAARECGEKVNVGADVSVGSFYTRELAPAQRLLNRHTPEWWMDIDGTVHTVARAGSRITSHFDVLDADPSYGRVTITTEFPEDWIPGRSFSSPIIPTKTISSLTHLVEGTNIKTEILTL